MQRLFILALAICITLAAALGIFLFVSLVPYFSLIGKVAAGVLITMLACVAILAGVFTYSLASNMLAKRRLIVAGEVVAYLGPNKTFIHLSAQHEAAKLPIAPMVTITEDPTATDETVLELWRKGLSLRDIVKVTGRKYHEVQEITSEAKKRMIAK